MSLLQDITLGQYFPSESPVHLLDPRSKFLIFSIIVFLLVLVINPFLYVVALLALLGLTLLAQLPVSLVFHNLRPFIFLLIVTFIFNLFQKSGEVVFVIPYLTWQITDESLLKAFAFTIRIILFVGFASIFTLTTTPMDIADGLARLLSPLRKLRIPVQDFAMMLTIAIRFVPILLEEAQRIRNAQIARGARFDGALKQRLRGLIPIVIPLFISAFRKAEDIALAMEARCYRLGKNRSSYKILKLKFVDYAALTGTILLAVITFSA